jgi:hypothetical protein
MSTSASYPERVRIQPGSPRAKTVTAGAVIVLATAIAGGALLAGIAAGSAVEAPGQSGVQTIQPAETTSHLPSTAWVE